MCPSLERLGHHIARSTTKASRVIQALEERPSLVVFDMASDRSDGSNSCTRLFGAIPSGCAVLAVGSPESPSNGQGLAQIADALAKREADTQMNGSLQDYGYMTVALHRREVIVHGTRIPLTPTEIHILSVLATAVGNYVSARRLVEYVYGYRTDEREAGDIIRVHIHNLRQKLNRAGISTPHILCARGKGYMLDRRGQPELSIAGAAVAGG